MGAARVVEAPAGALAGAEAAVIGKTPIYR
jgi:hypothetical protein